MMNYGICTFSIDRGPRKAGLVMDGRVRSVESLAAGRGGIFQGNTGVTVLQMLEAWDVYLPLLDELAAIAGQEPEADDARDLADCTIHPPVDLPRQIFCAGANYRQHVIDIALDTGAGPEGLTRDELRRWAENMMDERARTGEPYVFVKPVSAVAGAFDPIELPPTTTQLDWELELGVVIGKGGFRISREEAFAHIAGYAIVNDLSARDLIVRKDYPQLGTDWLRAKGQKGFLPFGPCLVPAHCVPDPEDLHMALTVGDKVMQDESTSDMVFGIARQIEYISQYTALLPGDLICTGSPAGNGTHHNRFLQANDIVVGEIEGLGQQRAVCILQD